MDGADNYNTTNVDPNATNVGDTTKIGTTRPAVARELAITDVETRFLFPFFFDSQRSDAVVARLGATEAGSPDRWELARARELYVDELLPQVAEYLFGQRRSKYLRLAERRVQALFHHARVALGPNEEVGIEPIPAGGIELFLTDHGVGILSIALRIAGDHDTTAQAIGFNYRVSQDQPRSWGKIRLKHPADDRETWERISDHDRSRVPTAPAVDAPLDMRLAHPGGQFALVELVEKLLSPLSDFGMQWVEQKLNVYTVARCSAEVDLADPAARAEVYELGSALAQVEEVNHAGTAGTVPIPHLLLNRRHWVGISSSGAAHVVSDQLPPPGFDEHPFNVQRVPRARDKYFVAYLLAYMQRLVLGRFNWQLHRLTMMPEAEAEIGLYHIRGELLQFAVSGQFRQVTSRHAVHRFFELARAALDVPGQWDDVQRSTAEIDARQMAARQQVLVSTMADHLGVVAHVQTMVEWIEIVLLSVYMAHLCHMVAEPWVNGHHEVSVAVLAFAVGGFAIAAAILRPWRLRRKPRGVHDTATDLITRLRRGDGPH